MDGVRVFRVPLYPSHDLSAVQRSMNYLSFAASATLLGPALAGPADVMWVYHPPLTVGIPACWMSLLRRVPFVFGIQDMWPETLSATGMVSSNQLIKLMGRLTRFIYTRAAAITVVSPGFKRNLVGKGVPADKIHIIPNWADEDVYHPLLPDPNLAQEYGLAGRFNIMCGGNLGAAQGMGNVVKAAQMLDDLPAVQFVLIGDGVEETQLREELGRRQLRNVRFLGRQPVRDMPRFFALANALLIHLTRDPLFEITIPGKTMAYLACGKPIICSAAGDVAQVVREAGAGLVCAPEDPRALARTVRELYNMGPRDRESMGQRGRTTFLTHYTREVLVDRYESLFHQIVAQHKNRRTFLDTKGMITL